jgi:hypothetical protein
MNSRPLCIVAGVKATTQNQKACTQSDGGGLHAYTRRTILGFRLIGRLRAGRGRERFSGPAGPRRLIGN